MNENIIVALNKIEVCEKKIYSKYSNSFTISDGNLIRHFHVQ